MDEFDAWMQMKRIQGLEMSTTLPSDAKPFCASTVSDSEGKEFTGSVSILPNGLTVVTSAEVERYFTSWLEKSEFLISEYSVSTTTNPFQKKNSNNGSIGPSQEEAEH